MYSGRVELGDLPAPNDEEKDENVCCIKLTGINDEHSQLNNSNEETQFSEAKQNKMNCLLRSNESWVHNLSGVYAQILVVFTSTALFAELFHERLPLFYIHDYLFLYLLGSGILLLIGAFINKFRESYQRVHFRDLINMPQYLSKKLVGEVNKLDIDQFFKTGIHVFGLSVIISSGLEVISTFVSPNICVNTVSALHIVLRCIFNGLQIAFFLMSSKEIWNIFGCIRNLAFMHLLATNTALWIHLIFWESAKDWEAAIHVKHNSSRKWERNELKFSVHALESDFNSVEDEKHYLSHVVRYTKNCYWQVEKSNEVDVISIHNCLENSTVGAIWSKATEFLYPISAQYYLIIMCVLYVIWVNFKSRNIDNYSFKLSKTFQNDTICSRSTKGLFLGLIILAASIVITIIFFVVTDSSKLILRILYCIIFGSSFFAGLLGLIQSKNMKSQEVSEIYCANFLQTSGLLTVYIYGSFNIIAGAISTDSHGYILSIEAVFMILHTSIQNMFVSQISKKKIDESNINEKPARQAVVYLILCNISLWFLECFVSWNLIKNDIQVFIFGNIAWPLLHRFMFQFILFYRFHSFVSLFKVWKNAYT